MPLEREYAKMYNGEIVRCLMRTLGCHYEAIEEMVVPWKRETGEIDGCTILPE